MAQFGMLSSKGQVVIPAKLRKELGLKAGEQVAFSVENHKLVISSNVWGAIDALYGKYAGLPLEEELMEDKRWERDREDRKLAKA
jgi:AbrB family looped-hinge helix DNA binding protein